MGRKPGTKLSQEQKDKMRMGRIQKRNKPIEVKVYEKPVLKISRHWKTGFDFWPAMRNVLRPLHRYDECLKLERAIVNNDIWQNKEEIIKILENNFVVEYKKLKNSCKDNV
jgi:hypothetical protein